MLCSERLYPFIWLLNGCGTHLLQRFVIRHKISTRSCDYRRTFLLARQLDSVRSADQSRSLSRDDITGRSLLPSSKFSKHGDEHESDSDSEDEENRDHRFKNKTGQLVSLSKPKLSQKSGIRKSLRPSKYFFRERRGWNEEKHWERRETPEDVKSKVSWYARQIMRLTEEDKVSKWSNLIYVLSSESMRKMIGKGKKWEEWV